MQKVGFIGIGVMGEPMARNLLNDGYQLSVFSRTKTKAFRIIDEGAIWCDTIVDCVKDADIVMTMVGYPKDVEKVYFGDSGIISNAKRGSCMIDFTTTSPKLSKRIYNDGLKNGLKALDAPVSGGDVGARDATLSIMVGGDKDVFDDYHHVFKSLGTNIVYEGPAGFGQHTKMANQIALSGVIASVCEAMSYARTVGLDLKTMLKSISTGAASSWQMTNMAPRILADNLEPGFYIKHFIKDMEIAKEEANEVNLDLVVLNDVLSMYKKLAKSEGLGELGTQALIKFYD